MGMMSVWGTLYPTLHRLKEDGYLASNTEVVDGKVRKYYRATGKEKNILESSKSKIHELTRAILEDR
jgi:PadR family transcriptional regulator PadR